MLKKKLTISLAYDCAKEWRTVVALQGGEQWLKAMPKSFTFAFRLGLSLSFNSKNKAPKKMGGTKSSQAALLALYLAREREREREWMGEKEYKGRERSFVESETSEYPSDPPSVYVITEMADWEREWRRRGQRRRPRQRQRRQPSSVLRYPRRLLGFSQSRYVVDVGRVFRIAIHL